MAIVTTYLKDGVADINELIRLMVVDLTGGGAPSTGTASEHMKLIYPLDLDLTSITGTGWGQPGTPAAGTQPATPGGSTLVILEATQAIDPFAEPDPLNPVGGNDPWRIAFHTSPWTGRSTADTVVPTSGSGNNTYTLKADTSIVNSLAIYLGTPSTLAVDATPAPTVGWLSSFTQKLPYYKGINPGQFSAWQYKATYAGKDLVEPVGNTGSQWTNTFDPTSPSVKFNPLQTGNPSPDNGPTVRYASPSPWDGPDVTDADQLFINRYLTAGSNSAAATAGAPATAVPLTGATVNTPNGFGGFNVDSAYSQPISYQITVTDHGLFLGCWGPDPEENGKGFSWLLAQRPVDKKTGITRGINPATGLPYTGSETDGSGNTIPLGNRPLFCINSVNGNFWKFVVREHDNPVPSARKDATKNTPDSGAVINPYQQQSLTENGEYVITFLNNLNSSRFKYADELDMLGTVSSDVVGGGSQINVSVYSEEQKRAYHALWSSGSFGTKMRIMVVADIPAPNQPWA